eukprot:TRINITY_DN8555_c0_g2_i2.p1 TRINITY_DN8555_c0_g2~~TRINITY_DN8555_c0_g2_i2.p1  ORF type:complete len:239 (+),score=72.21 TRINITY_DN8555_c0_g2_i2:62-718(+)
MQKSGGWISNKWAGLSKPAKIWSITAGLCTIITIKKNIFAFSLIHGMSMQPTFHTGDFLIWEKISTLKRSRHYETGDIVVFNFPLEPKTMSVKRVRAVGGESLIVPKLEAIGSFKEGQSILKDMEVAAELMIKSKDGFEGLNTEVVTIPKGYIWVEGDNPQFSIDSRIFGPIPENLVLGTPLFRLFPLDKMGGLKSDPNYWNGNSKGHTRKLWAGEPE